MYQADCHEISQAQSRSAEMSVRLRQWVRTVYFSATLLLPQENCFITALAALFPLKTTSRKTVNLQSLAGALCDLCVCTVCVCVAAVFPKKRVFLQLAEQE